LDEALRLRTAKEAIEKETPTAASPARIPANAATFRGHSYLAVLSPNVSWNEAREHCRKMGGDLASINDKEEFAFLRKLNGPVNLHVGGRRVETEWKWVDGKAIQPEFWHQNYPHADPVFAFVYINSVDSIGNSPERIETIPGYICEWGK
jgi:hypothetical protein